MTTATCIHHWRIETPNGPTSQGSCRRCGATRAFLNADPQDIFAGKLGLQQQCSTE